MKNNLSVHQKIGRKFQDNLHSLLTWFLNPKSKVLKQETDYPVRILGENICLGYQNLVLDSDVTPEVSITVPELIDNEYTLKDREYLKPVLGLKKFAQKELERYLSNFLLHGSLGTLDYAKGWSDFDTYLIIKKQVVNDRHLLMCLREKLLEAYEFLLKIDPLQHHGFLVCTETDLLHYPSFYLPPEIMKFAKSFFSTQRIMIKQIDPGEELERNFHDLLLLFEETTKTGIFKRHPYHGEYLLAEYKNKDNGLYQFKNFIGYLALAPAYFLQAQGCPTYKREAFKIVKGIVSPKSKDLLNRITALREEWPIREKFPYKGNSIPNWAAHLLNKDYFERGNKFIRELGNELGGKI